MVRLIMKTTNFLSLYFLSIVLLVVQIANAQDIYSKDGYYLFDGEQFKQSCIQGAKESMVKINGIKMDIDSYCQCCRENAFQQLTREEIKVAYENDRFMDLLTRDDVLLVISKCAQSKFEVSGDFKAGQAPNRELSVKSFTVHCMDDLKNSAEYSSAWTRESAREFCTCKAEKIYDGNFDFNTLSEMNLPSSVAYNEVFLACLPDEVVKRMNAFKNTYKSYNIAGKMEQTTVDLLKDVNGVFKVKLEIGNNISYLYLDTGASELILTPDLYNRYAATGNISSSDFLVFRQFQMADGTFINAEMYTLHNVKIGDFLVRETKVGVVESGLPLLETGFLANFKDWEVMKESRCLTLYK